MTWLITGTHNAQALFSGLFVWCYLILELVILCAVGTSQMHRPVLWGIEPGVGQEPLTRTGQGQRLSEE